MASASDSSQLLQGARGDDCYVIEKVGTGDVGTQRIQDTSKIC